MMATQLKLCVLGGDRRQLAMVQRLSELGYEVFVWGLGACHLEVGNARVCTDWEEAVRESYAVILPLPASTDGVLVNCPMESNGTFLRLSSLLERMDSQILLGGRIGDVLAVQVEQKGIRVVDYFQSELLQLKNALPTAEGAISIAMKELPITIDGLTCAVIGYGRIGMLLAQKLQALGAKVTVYARRREVRALAELYRHHTKALSESDGYADLKQLPCGCRAVFNTVPAWIMTREVLATVPKNCVLIDLASAPGGIDLAAAHELGLRTVWGTALPGKCTPESAGIILAQTVEELLMELSDPCN